MINLQARGLWVALVLIGAAGCDGTGSSTAPSAASPAIVESTSGVRGQVVDAESGWAYLIASDAQATTLPALAATVRDTTALTRDGRFAFAAAGDADQIMLSVPGRALTPVRLADDLGGVRLAPEAVVTCRVVDDEGAPQEDALALVLDEAGRVLPLPPADLVSRADGRLVAKRLPAGRFTLLIASGDDRRHAVTQVVVGEGAAVALEATVRVDDRARLRYLRVAGAPWPPAGAAEEAR